jgi:DNA-binding CsgD family transcriptional regulator/MFS family permease
MFKHLGGNRILGKVFLGNDPLINPSMFFGFGFHLMWVYAVIYMAFPSFLFHGQPQEELFRSLGTISWVVAIVVMLLMGWLIDRITYVIRRYSLQISTACMMAVSTICLFIAEYIAWIPLIIVGNVLAGVSSAFLFLIWGEAFRRQETPSIVLNSMLSVVVALLGYGLMTLLLPGEVVSAILCILPLFDITGLFFVMHGGGAFFNKQEFVVSDEGQRMPIYGLREVPTFRKLKVRRGMLLLRLAIPSFLFGMALGPLTLQAFTLLLDSPESSVNLLLAVVIACVAVCTLVIVLLVINRDEDYLVFYRFIVPVIAITIFFISFQGSSFALCLFTFIAYMCFSFMMWTEFSELSRHYRISPILVFGFGRAAAMTSQFISIVVLETVHIDQLFSASGNALNTFLILSMLLGYFLLPRDKAIREMAILDYKNPAGATKAGRSSEELNKGRFIVRCEYVANVHLLSSRETDVLYLLAKGRNAAYIAKHLFISEGTVHTHTWRIYRKMDVHTQQELMDLVDSYFIHDDGRVEEPANRSDMKKPPEAKLRAEPKATKTRDTKPSAREG